MNTRRPWAYRSVGMGLVGAALGLALGGLGGGCHRAFSCTDDAQCRLGDRAGRCEPVGYCSFADDACPSGYRYGEHASAALAQTCVDGGSASDSTGTVTSAEAGSSSGDGPGGSSGDTTADSSTTGSEEPNTTTGIPGECPPLVESGPIVARANGEVIEGLRITASGAAGITVSGFDNVVIRDCEIHHDGGPGISFAAADSLTIENVVIVHDRQEPGPHEHSNQANITGVNSDGLVIREVRVTRGSSGIELADTPGAQLLDIEGHDVRGPGPPASFIHVRNGSDSVIDGFSCINPLDTGRPGNLVEISESSNVVVRNGVLDGHNAQYGYGVLFQQTAGQHSGGLVEDVDAIRMTNGSFSGFPAAFDMTYRRTRARENICEILSVEIDDCDTVGENGGCVPGSNGRSWTSAPGVSGIVIEDSTHFELCHGPVWPEDSFVGCDGDNSTAENGDCGLWREDFSPRAPIEITPCWERGG